MPREEIWVTSKLWPSGYGDAAIDSMPERLGLDYIDLLYVHPVCRDIMSRMLTNSDPAHLICWNVRNCYC